MRRDHSSNSNFSDSLMNITKEDAISAAMTTLILGTDIMTSNFNKSESGAKSESDCDPEENDLVDEVARIEIAFKYLTKKKYPARYIKIIQRKLERLIEQI